MNSPLLLMPSEIREKILVNLVGDNFIHVQYFSTFRHAICVANRSEKSAYQDLVTGADIVPDGEDPNFYVESYQKRHENCKKCARSNWANTELSSQEKSSLRVDLSVLGVCRQLYEEANHLLWDTNTFSFIDPLTCNKFFASLNPAQKRNLSGLHISTVVSDYEDVFPARYSSQHGWLTALKLPCVNMLRNVRNLHICLEYRCGLEDVVSLSHDRAKALATEQTAMTANLEGILRLRALNTRQVTVILSDDNETISRRAGLMQKRFTVAEKIEYAENLHK